ncbi:uncharacterized [Tachysurus ichikawai]
MQTLSTCWSVLAQWQQAGGSWTLAVAVATPSRHSPHQATLLLRFGPVQHGPVRSHHGCMTLGGSLLASHAGSEPLVEQA